MRFHYFPGIIMVFLLCSGICNLARSDDTIAVSIRNIPEFADTRIQLQAMVNTLGFHEKNDFCVVGYESKDDTHPLPYIYWSTQNKLIEWDNRIMYDSIRYFDLNRDILPNGEVTNGYLHRSEANRIIQDCMKYGDAYTIYKPLEVGFL